MKRRRVEQLAKKYILPRLTGFEVTRGIIHATPIGDLLRGFTFDSSAFDRDVAYLCVFVQPLYVPEDHIVLTFGKRLENRLGFLRRNEAWHLDSDVLEQSATAIVKAMVQEGLPFLRKLNTPELFIRNVRSPFGLFDTVFHREAVAYSLARLGRYRLAERKLASVSRSVKPTDAWQQVQRNADRLRAAVRLGPAHAQELLDEWKRQTLSALRLPLGE